ncbi:unnamed protein product, partial [marine sediment metagenome]
MGSKKIRVGTPKIARRFEALGTCAIAKDASVNPKNRLPPSPMKTDAGGKLKNRKPRVAPPNAKAIKSKSKAFTCQNMRLN